MTALYYVNDYHDDRKYLHYSLNLNIQNVKIFENMY